MRFVYTVWFKNGTKPPDDPDFEWPACFLVEAASSVAAKEWGDRLAAAYALDVREEVIRSEAEPVETSALPGLDTLPIVAYGHDATREEIGW